jgi:D-glycero-D-manno-heptose 1,7-bisphosphate phosphatase
VGIGAVNRAVFLDRDGVLNRAVVRGGKPYPPSSLTELEILPGVAEALTDLKQRGFLLLVITNQPDVARGTQTREAVEELHRALARALPLDGFFVCYHDDKDDCVCRKPRPGLLLEAAWLCAIDLSRSFLIGDRWRDIEAGSNAGCATVLIDYGYAERAPAKEPQARVKSLRQAADWILRQD